MRIVCLLVVCALSACSAQSVPAVNRDAVNPIGGFTQIALPPASSSDFVVTDRHVPNARLAIHSIGIIATINGKSEKGYIPARCSVVDDGGVAKGCALTAKQTLHIKKIIAGLFTKAAARGCLAAAGKWHGTVPAGHVIPIVLYWTGYCG
ncbi:MAG TPA: hypothetical protein VFE36_07890 [Candidatus Baltobacteraceae bacterium]|nr:hypothetical protein [Candidatus Baltobacteraceae bacterium]